MRIAIIGSKGIPSAGIRGAGGIEAHVEQLSTRLVARGHKVSVYVRSYANPDRKKTWSGVRLVTVPTVPTKNLDTIVHIFLSTVHVLFQHVDVIHFHGVGPSTLAWIPRLFKPSAKVVVTFHSRDRFHGKWSWFARAYLAYGEWTAVTFPHVTIAVSHVIQVFCRKMYGVSAVYIPNGIEIPSLHPGTDVLKKFHLQPNEYFFTLCRLVPHKAIEDVISAFLHVKTKKKLVIIGSATFSDIDYEQELKRLAAPDPRIIFVGDQRGTDLQQLQANGYVMVHASRSEGLSVGVLEAMSYAKMVVMSDIPENLELIDHSGISYKVGDVDALREVMQGIAEDEELVARRGIRAREVVRRGYAWDSIVDRTEALYEQLFRLSEFRRSLIKTDHV